jgi:hypothetical protein
MKATGRRARPGIETGLVRAKAVGPAGDVRDRVVAEAARGGLVDGPRTDTARLRRFFIVSVSEDAQGGLHGMVEAVRSGRKERFQGLDALGPVVGALFRRLREDASHARPQ